MVGIDITPVLKRFSVYGKLIYDILRTLNLTKRQKLILGAGLAYFISPLDLIPGFIPVLGQLDDIIVALTVLLKILKELSPDDRNSYLEKFQITLEMIEDDLGMAKELAYQLTQKAVISTGKFLQISGKTALRLTSSGVYAATKGVVALAMRGKYKKQK